MGILLTEQVTNAEVERKILSAYSYVSVLINTTHGFQRPVGSQLIITSHSVVIVPHLSPVHIISVAIPLLRLFPLVDSLQSDNCYQIEVGVVGETRGGTTSFRSCVIIT